MIRSKETLVIKKDMQNPSNVAANAPMSYKISKTTQMATSTPVLNITQGSGSRNDLARQIFHYKNDT